jgi:hypothetical protein
MTRELAFYLAGLITGIYAARGSWIDRGRRQAFREVEQRARRAGR